MKDGKGEMESSINTSSKNEALIVTQLIKKLENGLKMECKSFEKTSSSFSLSDNEKRDKIDVDGILLLVNDRFGKTKQFFGRILEKKAPETFATKE